MREVTILTTYSAISTPALLKTISFSQAFSSVNHSVTLFQAVSHLRRLLDGDAFTARSGETFIEFLKELQPCTTFFPIFRTECGMVKLVKELQPAKALSPI